jgi:hypothetical protein
MPSIEEHHSFDAAVKKALAKERAERGIVDEPVSHTTYIAQLVINGKLKMIKNTDLEIFTKTASMYKTAFPNIPMHLYTYTELQSDQSAKVV